VGPVSESYDANSVLVAVTYGTALILLFSVSAGFHTCCMCSNSKMREMLHRGDRAMIYIFIAASYFPWLTLLPNGDTGVSNSSSSPAAAGPWQGALSFMGVNTILASDLRWTVWFLAAMGIVYQHVFHEKYKRLETLFYLAISFLPSLPFLQQDEIPGLWEIKLGGALYVIGVVFFKCDGRVPLAHAIWHILVALGASVHYYAVLTYLIGR